MTLRDELGDVTVMMFDHFRLETGKGRLAKLSVVLRQISPPGTLLEPCICARLIEGELEAGGKLFRIVDGKPNLSTYQLRGYEPQALFYLKTDLVARAVRRYQHDRSPAKAAEIG